MNQEKLLISAILFASILVVVHSACTANTNGVSGCTGADATSCLQGFQMASDGTNDVCSACAAGTTLATGTTSTTCDSCTAGYYCTAAASTASADHAPTACPAGYYCPSGLAASTSATACPAGYYCPSGLAASTSATACPAGFYCTASLSSVDGATPCDAMKYSAAGATSADGCLATTASITGCQAYTTSVAATASCAFAMTGYVPIPRGTPAATVTACIENCADCTTSSYGGCNNAQTGYYQDATTSTVPACTVSGCATCSTASTCTGAQAGYYWDTTNSVPGMCTAGQGAPGGTISTCSACTAAKNCATCTTVDFCTACAAGYVLTASTGVCTAYTGSVHGSCAKANDATATSCQSCDSTKFRSIELDTTATPPVAKAVGACVCNEGYGDQSGLSTTAPNYTCATCAENAKTCTVTASATTTTACKTGYYLAGNACASAAADLAGYFWTASTSVYAACNAGCLKCTAATASTCTACKEPVAFVEPLSNLTNYSTAIKTAGALINGTCYANCPTGYGANSARSACVLGSFVYPAPGGGAGGAASGIFSILALIIAFVSLF